ncbi:MAG: hypothetical protein AAFU73_23800 [Planctomycetota bacterium]
MGGGFAAAAPGDTRRAQVWCRSSAASGPASNFTGAIAIDLG